MIALGSFSQSTGDGWVQVADLLVAFVLASLIGLERELRQKSAGLRTHTLVGVGAALFMLVSKYGFSDVLTEGQIVLDPSRVAAQIVSGIGFIGGGLIFVRRDAVQGLTTAATIWISAAVGAAAGAGLVVLASTVTAMHFLVAFGYPWLRGKLPGRSTLVRMRYDDGRGLLREVLGIVTGAGFSVDEVTIDERLHARDGGVQSIDLALRVSGRVPVARLVSSLSELDGVHLVRAGDDRYE